MRLRLTIFLGTRNDVTLVGYAAAVVMDCVNTQRFTAAGSTSSNPILRAFVGSQKTQAITGVFDMELSLVLAIGRTVSDGIGLSGGSRWVGISEMHFHDRQPQG